MISSQDVKYGCQAISAGCQAIAVHCYEAVTPTWYAQLGRCLTYGKEALSSVCTVGNGVRVIVVGTTLILVTRETTRQKLVKVIREKFGGPIQTHIINMCSGSIKDDYRQQFKDCGVMKSISHSSPREHSHPEAARLRCVANASMRHFITKIGCEQFSTSMSKEERKMATGGNRFYLHAKDLQMAKKKSKFEKHHVETMTDVDYYINMPGHLWGQRVLLYTFVPKRVAGSTVEGMYATLLDGQVVTVVNGGAQYQHPLWNYDSDHFMIDRWWGSVMYLVEQVNVTDDRRVIFLNPIRTVYGPLGWLIPGKRLERRNDIHDGIAISRYLKTTGEETTMMYSMARAGEFGSAVMSSDAFHSSLTRVSLSKAPHLSDVERMFNAFKVENPIYAASVFLDVYKSQQKALTARPPIQTGAVDMHSYQATGPLTTEDGTPSMRAIWPGFTKCAFAPVRSLNNDQACLDGRIIEPKNKRPTLPPITYTYVAEFVKFLVPDNVAHTLAPEDFEYMWDKFKRPSQRSLITATENSMDIDEVKVRSFQKAEAYPKITAPRNISTLPADHNLQLGQFMFPFMEHILKETHWYAFGKHPNVMSQIVYEKSLDTSYVVTTDANKMDGSISGIFRDILVAAFCRAFAPVYSVAITRLENKERHVKASTALGLKYDTDETILSGSIITSVLGSLTNAFINYTALRYHHMPAESWRRMGLYGGDDGITFDLPATSLKRAAARYGMAFDADVVMQGMPLPFLGRLFIDPWTSGQNIADVLRQLRKLHLTATPKNVKADLVLHRKASGILVTDPQTPFLSIWAQAVIRLTAGVVSDKRYHQTAVDSPYWAKFEHPFPPPTDQQYVYGLVAEQLNMSMTELAIIECKFRSAEKLEDLYLVDIVHTDLKVTVDAVRGGELLRAQPRKKIPQIVEENAKLPHPMGMCKYGVDCRSRNCRRDHPPPQVILHRAQLPTGLARPVDKRRHTAKRQ